MSDQLNKTEKVCPHCGGEGILTTVSIIRRNKLLSTECPYCEGRGTIPVEYEKIDKDTHTGRSRLSFND